MSDPNLQVHVREDGFVAVCFDAVSSDSGAHNGKMGIIDGIGLLSRRG